MTDELILEIAEKYFDYQGGWIADTKDLLKFARTIHEDGYDKGYYNACLDNAGCVDE